MRACKPSRIAQMLALSLGAMAIPVHAAKVTVITAGQIHTMDTAHPRAQAMAYDDGGAILALGDRATLLAKYPKVVLDLTSVTYVDSATIGCLMDLYRQATAAGGALKLAGVQKRVETMLSMTGAHNFLEIHGDEAAAVKSFGA